MPRIERQSCHDNTRHMPCTRRRGNGEIEQEFASVVLVVGEEEIGSISKAPFFVRESPFIVKKEEGDKEGEGMEAVSIVSNTVITPMLLCRASHVSRRAHVEPFVFTSTSIFSLNFGAPTRKELTAHT